MRTIFTFLLFSIYSISSFSQDYTGNWIGEISIPSGKLEIAFKIIKDGNIYKSTLDIPKQGLNGAKAETTKLTDTILTMTFPNYKLEYKGSLNDKNEIVGNLIQGSYPLPLNLKRGEIILNRPQEPKPPFNYYLEDITFITSDNIKLKGTLSLPKKDGNFPVVIIISGSGAHNRYGEMYGHKPYLVIADDLTKNGIGVLRFDERGIGQSEGNFETSTIDVQSSDITSAIEYLKTRKEINTKKIGLLGHSIGGIVAPKVASENKSVNFIVLLAAPAINGDKLMLLQRASADKLMGASEEQIAQGQDLLKGAYDIVVNSNLNNTTLKDSLNSFYINKYGKMLPENSRKGLIEQIASYEVVSMLKSEPSIYLEKIKCPVLAINGDKDFQVPAKENLSAIKTLVEQNGNKKVTIVELENLNHLFQESKTGLLDEYAEIEQTISPKVLKLITDWIKQQTN